MQRVSGVGCVGSCTGSQESQGSEGGLQTAQRSPIGTIGCVALRGQLRLHPMMTPKKRKFAHEYLLDLVATKAAIRAGYAVQDDGSVNHASAATMGSRLLQDVDVSALIAKLHNDRLQRTEIRADDILREISRVALSSPKGLVDEDGVLLPIEKLSDDTAAALASFKIKTDEDGKALLQDCRMQDKVAALGLMSKHFGLMQPERHLHAHISLSPDLLARCSDDQLRRIEEATTILTTIQSELADGESSSDTITPLSPSITPLSVANVKPKASGSSDGQTG